MFFFSCMYLYMCWCRDDGELNLTRFVVFFVIKKMESSKGVEDVCMRVVLMINYG